MALISLNYIRTQHRHGLSDCSAVKGCLFIYALLFRCPAVLTDTKEFIFGVVCYSQLPEHLREGTVNTTWLHSRYRPNYFPYPFSSSPEQWCENLPLTNHSRPMRSYTAVVHKITHFWKPNVSGLCPAYNSLSIKCFLHLQLVTK